MQQQVKYYYQGMPLVDYCNTQGLDIDYIRTRIWKLSKKSEFSHLTQEQIIKTVLEKMGTGTKYFYKGVSLRQYCIQNGLNPTVIQNRIAKFREEHPNLTDEELVTLAMEEHVDKRQHYFYYGIPLKDYCDANPELDYNSLREYIRRNLNETTTVEQLIDIYSQREHKGAYKWYYRGIPLKKYCEDKGVNYPSLLSFICRFKKEHPDLSILRNDEFIELIMEEYRPAPKPIIYARAGMTLKQYCKAHSISYYRVVTFMSTKSVDNQYNDTLIEEALSYVRRYAVYYYNGIPLKDYAEANNMNYNSLRSTILRISAKSPESLQEIIDSCVSAYKKISRRYYYKGKTLPSVCQDLGLDYNQIVRIYLREFSADSSITTEDAIEKIINSFLDGSRIRTKYFVGNESLRRFCDTRGYSYSAIWHRMKNLFSTNISTEEAVSQALQNYEERLHIRVISQLFEELKMDNISQGRIKEIQ